MCLHSWSYMITHSENEDENEKKSYRYDISIPRSRYKKQFMASFVGLGVTHWF